MALHALRIPEDRDEIIEFVHFEDVAAMRERLAHHGEVQAHGIAQFENSSGGTNTRAPSLVDQAPRGDVWFLSVTPDGHYRNVDPMIVTFCFGHEPLVDPTDDSDWVQIGEGQYLPGQVYLWKLNSVGVISAPKCCDGDEKDGDEVV